VAETSNANAPLLLNAVLQGEIGAGAMARSTFTRALAAAMDPGRQFTASSYTTQTCLYQTPALKG